MKASPRCLVKNPKERNLRGDRALAELNPPSMAADRRLDQGPEGEATETGACAVTQRQVAVVNDRRARAVDETARLGGGKKPLKGESRTWQRDETSPQGRGERKPSRARETPRAEQ